MFRVTPYLLTVIIIVGLAICGGIAWQSPANRMGLMPILFLLVPVLTTTSIILIWHVGAESRLGRVERRVLLVLGILTLCVLGLIALVILVGAFSASPIEEQLP